MLGLGQGLTDILQGPTPFLLSVHALAGLSQVQAVADAAYNVWAKYRLPLSGRPSLDALLEERRRAKVRCRTHAAPHLPGLLSLQKAQSPCPPIPCVVLALVAMVGIGPCASDFSPLSRLISFWPSDQAFLPFLSHLFFGIRCLSPFSSHCCAQYGVQGCNEEDPCEVKDW